MFLPYDLEFTYASSLYLAIANALFPRVVDGQAYNQRAHLILDEMICKGNKIAEVRKAQLSHLDSLLLELTVRAESQGFQSLTLSSPRLPGTRTEGNPGVEEQQQEGEPVADQDTVGASLAGPSQSTDAQLPSDIEFLNDIGISSYEFYSIVDQITNSDLPYSILDSGPN